MADSNEKYLVRSAQLGNDMDDVGKSAQVVDDLSLDDYIDSVSRKDKAKKGLKIDFAALSRKGFIDPAAPRNQLIEEYRKIKRPLLNNAFGLSSALVDKGNLIMVTSSVANEGKTFTSINLAISCAMELDKTVLLVDVDLLKPSLFKTLGLPSPLGVSDYLAGNVSDISTVMLRTNIENLAMISAGTLFGTSTELLSSDKMLELMGELQGRYKDRVIIFDSSPLLVSNEAKLLSELVGQVVMVVESGKTRQNDLMTALEQLSSDACVNFVLNKCKYENKGGGYYYYNYSSSDDT